MDEVHPRSQNADTARHDVAYVQLPDGRSTVIAIFAKNNSQQTEFIPFLAKKLIEDK